MTPTAANAQEQLAEALESPRCFCGKTKKMKHPLCLDCFNLLPTQSRAFLWRGTGDPNAYLAAIEWLKNHGVETQC